MEKESGADKLVGQIKALAGQILSSSDPHRLMIDINALALQVVFLDPSLQTIVDGIRQQAEFIATSKERNQFLNSKVALDDSDEERRSIIVKEAELFLEQKEVVQQKEYFSKLAIDKDWTPEAGEISSKEIDNMQVNASKIVAESKEKCESWRAELKIAKKELSTKPMDEKSSKELESKIEVLEEAKNVFEVNKTIVNKAGLLGELKKRNKEVIEGESFSASVLKEKASNIRIKLEQKEETILGQENDNTSLPFAVKTKRDNRVIGI